MSNTLIVSACLLGEACRYDAASKRHAAVIDRVATHDGPVVPVCPEMLGGLPTPRPPADLRGGDGAVVLAGEARVLRVHDDGDVTHAFVAGATRALTAAGDATSAILKARSPSCGVYRTYIDGQLTEGSGVFAAMLRARGVHLRTEEDLDDASHWDARYAHRGPLPGPPSEILAWLPVGAGDALDLAAGSGRQAVAMAEQGFRVTAVDISREGLNLALQAAAARGVALHTTQLDLTRDPLPPGPFAVVTCVAYLNNDALRAACATLQPGGRLLFAQPTTTNLERYPRPPRRYLIETAPALPDGMRVLHVSKAWRASGRHELWLVAERLPQESLDPNG